MSVGAVLRLNRLCDAAWRYALLLVAGVLQAFATAWPWGGQTWGDKGGASGTLQILALAVALMVLPGQTQGAASASAHALPARSRFWQGFRRGWCFATAWLAATFWWLFISMHTYGGLPGWLAALAVLLLAAALALYYAVALGMWCSAWPQGGVVRRVVLFAALWLLAELCRGVFLTGFPWGAIGYAHIDSALAGYAPWVGVYGISALAAASAACLSAFGSYCWQTVAGREAAPYANRKSAGLRLGAMVAALLLIAGVGAWQKHAQQQALVAQAASVPRPALEVALLQGNIPQDEKFQSGGGMELALEWYWQQMQASPANVVVLPETALPVFPHMLPNEYWQSLQQRLAQAGKPQAVLMGMFAGDAEQGYANAAIGMAAGKVQAVGAVAQADLALPPAMQAQYSYAKHHLVPFGEFVPPGFQWLIDMMRIPLGEQQRGALAQPRMLFQGERLQPNICYEDLFGEELARSFIDPATAPTILVNMSNIAWFGDTVAIDQHRHISRMRAKELARPMLRATNTGSTAVIDAAGQVQAELPRLTRGVLQAKVVGNHAEPTFFAWWAARWGLWPLWLLALATGLLAWPWRARGKTE